MKPRSIRAVTEKGFEDTPIIAVPLGRDGEQEALIDLQDYKDLVALGVSPNWQLRGGNVSAKSSNIAADESILVARVLMDARPGQMVRFKDRDYKNLQRSNLSVVSGRGKKPDRSRIIEGLLGKLSPRKSRSVMVGKKFLRGLRPA